MFFRRRPIFMMRRPLGRRRYFRRGCLPGCFTFLLLGALIAAAYLALLG